MDNGRVKYYPSNDFFFAHNFSKIEVIQIPELEEININDALEFYQIKRYFDENTRDVRWTDAEYAEYEGKSKKLNSLTNSFFNKIDDENIVELYNAIEFGYHSDFWVLFEKCKLFKRISDTAFKDLLQCKHISPYDLFKHKEMVKKYGEILKSYILENEFCIPIIIDAYEQNVVKGEKLVFPQELTGEDICDYLESYIESEHPNPNYLETIIYMHPTKQFPITDEIRLKAKRRYTIAVEAIMKNGIHTEYGLKIVFDPNQEETVKPEQEGDTFCISYSTKWLLDTLDNPSILNNFIGVFEFVDFPQMRSLHVNKESLSSVLERVFGSKADRIYRCNSVFNSEQAFAMMQMHGYYSFLKEQGIYLEDVLHWFFTEYLQTEYDCPEIRVSMPSKESSYAEKCSSIITAIETILKQYYYYVKNGEIDFELIAMSSTPILLKNINSLVDKKYVYGQGEEYNLIKYWLFSDQCMFSYVERIHDEGRSYDRFIELLLKEPIYISDYHDKDRNAFEKMAEYDLIAICEDGRIIPKDKVKLVTLKDLFENDVISQHHYPQFMRYAIKEFVEKGLLVEKSTLLSEPEINYLNYLLNRSEYDNGLEIRNKYIHGTEHVNKNDDEHKKNYLTLLRIFVLLVIKINDDFCLREESQSN